MRILFILFMSIISINKKDYFLNNSLSGPYVGGTYEQKPLGYGMWGIGYPNAF